MDDSRVICSRRVSDDWTISAATVQSSLTRLDLFSSLYRGFQPIGIYTNYVQQNPTGGSRWIVQSQPTRTGKIPPESHHRQVVDRSSPTCAIDNGKQRSGLNDPPPAGGGILEDS